MKKALIYSLVFLLIIQFCKPAYGQTISNKEKKVIEKQVDSIFHTMLILAENLDYDKLSKSVDDNKHAGFITNGSYYANYDSLIAILKIRSQNVLKQSLTIHDEKITVLSESIVLLTTFGEAKMEVTSGNSFNTKFYWSFVYEKINNVWKVIQSHQSISR